tara:strand:+ start:506 stop:664 length:159 start_codon:yes stop_codon:yes gene_type:complete
MADVLDKLDEMIKIKQKELDAFLKRKKGPKFIVDSKGRVKKMYNKGGQVRIF